MGCGSVRGDRTGLGPAETSGGSVSFCRLWPLIPRQSQPTHCNVDSSLQAPQPQFPHLPPMKSKHCSLLTEGGANRETALSREGSSSSEHWSATLGKSRSLPGPGPPHSSLFRCTPLTAATGGGGGDGDCSQVCLIPHCLDFRSEWHIRATN